MSIVRKRVLVVDDSITIRTLLKLYLMPRRFDTFEAANGAAALELLSKERIDLIITDFNMPGMTGVEFMRKVRGSRSSNWEAPIILLSSEPDLDALRKAALAAGAGAILKKPISGPDLLTVVDRMLPALSDTRA